MDHAHDQGQQRHQPVAGGIIPVLSGQFQDRQSAPERKGPEAVEIYAFSLPVLLSDLFCCAFLLLYFTGAAPGMQAEKKETAFRLSLSVLALPIFPGRRQPSIISRNELNYRVRNGNGWTLALISTNCLPV